jgi:hypothetical protein
VYAEHPVFTTFRQFHAGKQKAAGAFLLMCLKKETLRMA